MPKIYDTIVIGGGPGGMTAALNVLRGGRSCLLLERENFGGQIATSPKVENLPSIKSIPGSEFSSMLFDQIEALGVEYELENALSIEKKGDNFLVNTDYGTHEAKTIVIASGVVHRTTGLPNEEELVGKGVSYCATCDGAFYKDQEIYLIGDANTAIQYTLLLSTYCKKVTVCALFDHLFADKILQDILKTKANVEVKYNLQLKEFVEDDNKELKALRFFNKTTNNDEVFPTKGVFVAIGQIPDNKRFSNLVELDDKGYIKIDERNETATKGIYAVGDCTTTKVKQVVTAASAGSVAAFHILNYLNSKE